MSHSDPVHSDEPLNNNEHIDVEFENLFHCNEYEKCNLVEQKLQHDMQNADNAKLEDVIKKSEQYLFVQEFNDQNL